jgi:hypothetical protein
MIFVSMHTLLLHEGPLHPLCKAVHLGELAILIIHVAHITLWERRQNAVMLGEFQCKTRKLTLRLIVISAL